MTKAWGNIKQVTRTNRPMIKLRVVRVFQRTNDYSSYKNILEIVFHDNEGGRITAIIRAINIPTFINKFQEGVVYALRNYQVESNIGMYRSTIAKYRLILHGRTEHISYKGDFPIYRFDFRRFITLVDVEKIDESILFDVIGMVVEINPVQLKNVKGVQTRMIAFSLMDPEGNIMPCTLWGPYVDQFLNFESELAHGNPWTLIIQLGRSRAWAEKVQITSSKDITRLIAGENIPDIAEFRNRAASGPLRRARLISKSSVVVKSELQELADGDVVVSSVDSLYETAEETDVWVCATVVSIIDEWWYNSCRRCTSKMEEANGELNCSKCSHKFGIFRYKIHFGVQDTSAPATLIAWNNECEPIIGKPCDALRREIMQKNSNSIELPEEIDNMIHKSYLFKVRIRANRRKFGDGDAAFSVVRMIGDENLVSKYSQWVTDKEESDFLTLLQKEEAKGKDCNEEEEVSTPVKTRNGKEKVGDNSNAKRSLMDIIEDEAGFVAQSATAMKGKAKVTEQDDEMKDIFDEE